MQKITKPLSLVIIVAALVILGYFYYKHAEQYPSTNDAYVRANIVNIAPQVDGKVDAVKVHDHQWVKKGQLLFTINSKPYLIAVAQQNAALINAAKQVRTESAAVKTASAQVNLAHANVVNASKNEHRIAILVHQHLASPSQGDDALNKLNVAKASLHAAISQLKQARATLGKAGADNATVQVAKAGLAKAILNLHYTKVYAPASGYINNFDLRVGQTVTAYENLFALVESNQWWVNANYKETDLRRIRRGQPATVKLDIYPNHVYHGVVQSISSGSGSAFSLLPPENASGNWVKVTQRFPVRIRLKNNKAFPLRVGASASVKINTAH